MRLVIDASTVVAALVDDGETGRWAEDVLRSGDLAAPHLMPVEAANVLRRAGAAGQISSDTAALAHADLLELRVALFPYVPFAARAWELRHNLTTYDACYVALAEELDCPMVTLDMSIARAAGPRCEFVPPPGGKAKR